MSALLRTALLALALASVTPLAGGCRDAGVEVVAQQAEVACGTCVFQIPGGAGCFWAIELDGRHYWVQGVAPQDAVHAHGPEGMCTLARKATVEGRLVDDRFVATRFELLPLDGTERRAGTHDHAH